MVGMGRVGVPGKVAEIGGNASWLRFGRCGFCGGVDGDSPA